MSQKRALIAMSGGVDSSVAASLMLEQGYDCIGCTMRLYESDSPSGKTCCNARDIEDAAAVAAQLGIPFHVINLTEAFQERVVMPFCQSYLAGRTPNPCILCNREIKFDLLYERAWQLHCDYVVTGHYARVTCEQGRYHLRRALRPEKDQSYVLYDLNQELLAHTLFPLGNMTKDETRQLAAALGLHISQKRDSQDICFVPDGDYARVVQAHTHCESAPGDFVDADGHVLGRHQGIIHYTVGQRRGLGVSSSGRLYVQEIRVQENQVVLGDNASLYASQLLADSVNWVSGTPPAQPIAVQAKIRYRHTAQPATAQLLADGTLSVQFEAPQRAITPGQSVVLYQDDDVLGGGSIIPEQRGEVL